MIDLGLIEAFNDGIDRLAAGQSIEDCLRAHPPYAAVLHPMLEAGQLTRRAAAAPNQVVPARERGQFRLEAAMDQALPRAGQTSRNLRARAAVSVAAVILILGVLLSGMAFAAESSLPDDALYGVKRLTEQVRLTLSGDDPALAQIFEQRRLEETRQLLAQGREAEVMFRGTVESIDEKTGVWVVAGLPLSVSAETITPEAISPGSRVEVEAATLADGRLLAQAVRLADGRGENPVVPTQTPIPTTTESPTARPSPTLSATPTPTAQRPTATPTATVTRSETTQAPTRSCQPQQAQDWSAYIVQAGDRLAVLAERTGITVEMVVRVNCIRDPNVLQAGQVLYLPAPVHRCRFRITDQLSHSRHHRPTRQRGVISVTVMPDKAQ